MQNRQKRTRKYYHKRKRLLCTVQSSLFCCVKFSKILYLLDDLLAERAVVFEEALAGLNAEPACANHLAHQRMRTVLRVAGLVVQS